MPQKVTGLKTVSAARYDEFKAAVKPGTFRLLFNDQGKAAEGWIVLYRHFEQEAVMSDGN